MDNFIKVTGLVLMTTVLIQLLSKTDKDISTLLSLAACVMVVVLIAPYASEVFSFLKELQRAAKIDNAYLNILMKSLGIGLITEISVLVCNDSGNSALGRSLQILGALVILRISVPAFEALLQLMKDFLGEA